jgi:diacylglycerol kinase (ATP)
VNPHVAAIVNPRSGNGRTGRAWRLISDMLARELGPIRAHFTASPSTPNYLPAAELTRMALHEGAQLVIAVGGDGTINEVVNGFFEDEKPVNPEAHLALLHAGTGGDFRKSFDISGDMGANIALIARGTSKQIDLGRAHFAGEDGSQKSRYFANIASFGLSGDVVRAVNGASWPKLFGGKFTFLWTSLLCAARHRTRSVRLTSDCGFDEVLKIGTVAICNGRYFGGGMMIAPLALPDDGLFDVVILRDAGLIDMLGKSRSIYGGKHLDDSNVTHFRARQLTATPVDREPVLIDMDGEMPGLLPARFEILPRAITLRC